MTRHDGTAAAVRAPAMSLPVQAPPVVRADRAEEPAPGFECGVDAAQSECSRLTGLARQMCYSLLYGVNV